MPFNSYEFIFAFLPATVAIFWLLVRFAARRVLLGWLILASIIFYVCTSMTSLAIILPTILVDFMVAKWLLRASASQARLRTALFSAGIVFNVGVLAYFKYKNFFLEGANVAFGLHFGLAQEILPLGISFMTFQMIAFLADVRSGQLQAIRFTDFLLFALFFPRSIAGPIVHYGEVVPQLESTPRSPATNVAVGIFLFSMGLFKKCVIADGVAQFVSPAFDPSTDFGPLTLLTAWTGALAFTFQLYFDFSGYSDMALGAARMLGIQLPMNFNSPWKSSSILEFWSRWHITLTRFLTSYLYTPILLALTRARIAAGKPVLQGKRSSLTAIAILVSVPTLTTMTLAGLWHGAGWGFVAFGLLHGIYLTINQSWRLLRPRFWADKVQYDRIMKPLGIALTFGAMVASLVFFRATSIESALSVFAALVGLNGVLPLDAQLLHLFGINLPWSFVQTYFEPLTPFVCIISLLFAVMFMPNSLELLRRYRPALDFPADSAETPEFRLTPPGEKTISSPGKLRGAWSAAAMQLACNGLTLNRLTALLASLLWVLGVAALTHSQSFQYQQY